MRPQFRKRREKAAEEIRNALDDYGRGGKHAIDELAGVLIEYQRTILLALEGRRPKYARR